MIFFLEIQLNSGTFVTVRRGVEERSKVWIKVHETKDDDYSSLPDSMWTQVKLPLEKGKESVDKLLALSAIAPWKYRKGVSYFLRTQSDYLDVFQISKFSRSKHGEWKPYLATIFGFSRKLIDEKYALDASIDEKQTFRRNYSKEVRTETTEYDRIKGMIEIKRNEIDHHKDQLGKFDFLDNDREFNTELVKEIETQVAEANETLYEVRYEINKIDESLASKMTFDLGKVRQLFSEVEIYFAESLVKDYEALIKFNERLSQERNRRLKQRLLTLKDQQQTLEKSLSQLNGRREQILGVLQTSDTFAKFRRLQAGVIEQEVEVARLEAELENLDAMSRIDREIRTLTQKRQELVNKIEDEVNTGNATYSVIRQRFNEIIREVLSLPALVSTSVNTEGNLEFHAALIQDEKSLKATSEGKGTSYKKLLCAAFDIAVLEAHASKSFFRFVYHDGILEGLDNRKKAKFLSVISEFCDHYGLQYILTVIDADLPRNEKDEKVPFPQEAVIRELHERGADGRLFNMPTF